MRVSPADRRVAIRLTVITTKCPLVLDERLHHLLKSYKAQVNTPVVGHHRLLRTCEIGVRVQGDGTGVNELWFAFVGPRGRVNEIWRQLRLVGVGGGAGAAIGGATERLDTARQWK